MKRMLILLCLCLTIFSAGCGKTDIPDISKSSVSSAAENADTQMPDIVFLCAHWDEEGKNVSLTFWDKNGEYYSCDGNFLTSPFLLHLDELVNYFNEEPQHFTKHEQTCDVSELKKHSNMIYEIAQNENYTLEYPQVMPDVEADSFGYYGLYYDDNAKLTYILFHVSERTTPIYANDDRANEIFKWYTESIKSK